MRHGDERPGVLRYGMAAVASAAALGLSLAVDALGPNTSTGMIFVAAVMLSSWYGGLGPGLLATVLSALAIDVLLLTPRGELNLHLAVGDLVRLVVFVVVALLINSLDQARRRLAEWHQQRVDELAAADRRKDEFLALLGHELRGPLAPIRQAVALLEAGNGDPAQSAEARAVVRRQVAHMARLIDDLLDASRLARGKIRLRWEAVALADVVERALEIARPALDARGHHLAVELPAEPVWLDADPARLAQVLANLLDNAAKYTEPGGHVALAAARDGDAVRLAVRDDGIGMGPEALARAFDLFAQEERAVDRAQGGLGIGLNLVRDLVRLHGGTVEARSAGPGQGSEFVVRLPASAEAPPAPRNAPDVPPPAPAGPAPRRILVVDDEDDSARTLAFLLGYWGHDVRTAADGPEALDAAREHRPDVVLLDISLPGMDGFEVARRLRDDVDLNGIVIVALTGYLREDDERFRDPTFDHHVVKPFEIEDLLEIVAQGRSALVGRTPAGH